MTDRSKDNPFYSNHVFTDLDFGRVEINRWTRFWLCFLTTYAQIGDSGYVFFYKRWNGRYYLVDYEPLP